MCMIDSVGVPGKPTRKFSGFTSLVIILGWFASCAFSGILNLKQGFRGCRFDWHPKCSTCKRDPCRAPFSAYQAPVEGVKLRNINWSCFMSIAANNINGPGIQSWRRCLSWTFQQAAKPSAPQGLDQATPTPAAKICDHLASKVQNQRMEDRWWVTPARISVQRQCYSGERWWSTDQTRHFAWNSKEYETRKPLGVAYNKIVISAWSRSSISCSTLCSISTSIVTSLISIMTCFMQNSQHLDLSAEGELLLPLVLHLHLHGNSGHDDFL